MRWAIITLTKNALELAYRVKDKFPYSDVFTLPRWKDRSKTGTGFINENMADFAGSIFSRYDTLVFIMAAGIVVRSIARYINDKTTDPAVIVIDEKGKFAISLLSGHIGGANRITLEIAASIGATPVITTASDLNEKLSVDMIAARYGLAIENMEHAKTITAMIVNDQKVSVVSDFKMKIPHYLDYDHKNADGLILITNKIIENPEKPYVRLIPRNIVLGIGCKKGTDSDKLIKFLDKELDVLSLDKRSILSISSIELKKNERAIHDAAGYIGCDIVFFGTDDISEIENEFEKSEFVKQTAGVGAVCEPAAYLAGGKKGKFVLRKTSYEGMTLAIFEKEVL